MPRTIKSTHIALRILGELTRLTVSIRAQEIFQRRTVQRMASRPVPGTLAFYLPISYAMPTYTIAPHLRTLLPMRPEPTRRDTGPSLTHIIRLRHFGLQASTTKSAPV